MRGGTFGNFTEKKLLPFTDTELLTHLSGEQLAGVYPLMPDNTSWFIAADFDKENWLEECKLFQSACEAKQIPAYFDQLLKAQLPARCPSLASPHIFYYFYRKEC